MEYSLSDGSGWSLSQPEIKDVTDGTTVYYRVSMANYNTVTGSATVTIKPKEVVLSWTGNCAHTYTGRIPGVTAAVVGTVSGDSCAVTGYTGNTERMWRPLRCHGQRADQPQLQAIRQPRHDIQRHPPPAEREAWPTASPSAGLRRDNQRGIRRYGGAAWW